MPFMTKEIDASLEVDGPYIAMSDRLVLYPHNGTSTAVWDMEDDRSLGLLEGHTSPVFWASINKKTAVTISNLVNWVGPVKIWSLETMQCTANLTTTSSAAAGLLKDRLLLRSEGGPIKVWDIGGSTPVALMDLQGHTDYTFSIDASDISNVALSGSRDHSVRLWDLRTGQCVRVMEGREDQVNSVSMDSACKTAVSGSDDKTVKLWDLGSGQCIETYEHGREVCDVMMHESGSSFLSVGGGVVKAWATASGPDRPLLDADLSALCDPNEALVGAASRDLSRVGVCSWDPCLPQSCAPCDTHS
jgi:WD40 repeat protein